MDRITRRIKDLEGRKESTEIGIVTAIDPHFKFKVNGQEYSSEHFTVYLPAVDRIKQYEAIEVQTHVKTKDDNPEGVSTTNIGQGKGEAYLDIGDLELEPDSYERRFLVGDLVDVTDRGDSFIVHGRLVKIGDTDETYTPTHRDKGQGVKVGKSDPINKPPMSW